MSSLARSILRASHRFTGTSSSTTASPAKKAYLTCMHTGTLTSIAEFGSCCLLHPDTA